MSWIPGQANQRNDWILLLCETLKKRIQKRLHPIIQLNWRKEKKLFQLWLSLVSLLFYLRCIQLAMIIFNLIYLVGYKTYLNRSILLSRRMEIYSNFLTAEKGIIMIYSTPWLESVLEKPNSLDHIELERQYLHTLPDFEDRKIVSRFSDPTTNYLCVGWYISNPKIFATCTESVVSRFSTFRAPRTIKSWCRASSQIP